MTVSDAEIAFYQSVVANPEGKSLNDLRYAFYLGALLGEIDLGGGGGTGDVQFTVARAGAGTILGSSTWVTYPLDGTPSVNVGGGSWNGTTFVYTVPVNGLYLCLGAIRSAESIAARSLALAIGTANADGAHVLWGTFGGTNADQSRTGRQYTRLARFNANDLVRMYIYSDGVNYTTQYDAPTTSAAGQFMSIVKVAD